MTDAKQPNPVNQPLRIAREGDRLVISIGLNVLKCVVENCPELFGNESRNKPPYVTVSSKRVLVEDMIRALTGEEEDGSTPVTAMLDHAIAWIFEDGSQAFKENRT